MTKSKNCGIIYVSSRETPNPPPKKDGEVGDLVVFDPIADQVYAHGQKDHRGRNTEKDFVKWDGERFVKCDILGRVKDI